MEPEYIAWIEQAVNSLHDQPISTGLIDVVTAEGVDQRGFRE